MQKCFSCPALQHAAAATQAPRCSGAGIPAPHLLRIAVAAWKQPSTAARSTAPSMCYAAAAGSNSSRAARSSSQRALLAAEFGGVLPLKSALGAATSIALRRVGLATLLAATRNRMSAKGVCSGLKHLPGAIGAAQIKHDGKPPPQAASSAAQEMAEQLKSYEHAVS